MFTTHHVVSICKIAGVTYVVKHEFVCLCFCKHVYHLLHREHFPFLISNIRMPHFLYSFKKIFLRIIIKITKKTMKDWKKIDMIETFLQSALHIFLSEKCEFFCRNFFILFIVLGPFANAKMLSITRSHVLRVLSEITHSFQQ